MAKSVVVLGGSGFVGSRFCELSPSATELIAPKHSELDVLDTAALAEFVRASKASAVVNFAAWADVDGAEREVGDTGGRVYALNARYPRELAAICAKSGIHLLHVSTDYVFDGTRIDRPYLEDDPTGPALCWYAETKLQGERAVLDADGMTVARIEMPFSGRQGPRRDFARTILGRLQQGQTVSGVVDQRITPVFLDDAVRALWLLAESPQAGALHVAAASWTTPFDFARAIARRLNLDEQLIEPVDFATFVMQRAARRPQHSWLDVSLFVRLFGEQVLRSVEAELESWCNQLAAELVPSKV